MVVAVFADGSKENTRKMLILKPFYALCVNMIYCQKYAEEDHICDTKKLYTNIQIFLIVNLIRFCLISSG